MCLNQTTVFHDTSETYGEPVINWSWNFGEPSSGPNNTSTIKDPTHTYASRDTFDVRLVVMNRFGCKDSLTKSTRIYGLPEAHFDNTVACMGDATYFYDMTLASDTIMRYWHWDFGDITWNDTSHLQNPVYKYPDAGNYAVQLIVTDYFGCMDTVDSTVTVNITPVSVFTITENFDGKPGRLKLNNESTGANGYLWDFGNGKTSTEENPIAIYVEDGTYIIKLIALNEFDCSDTTFFEYELLFKGLFIPNAFAPASTDLGIRLFKPVGINLKQYHIQVFDQWGTLMWESTKIDSGGHPEEGWDGVYRNILMPQGTYMWKVKATFIDDTPWTGSDIGQGDYKTIGTVTLIR
jgi:PKD repeat protein